MLALTALRLALAAGAKPASTQPEAETGFETTAAETTAASAAAGLGEHPQSGRRRTPDAMGLRKLVIPGGAGVGLHLGTEALTLTAEFTVGELPRTADFRIIFAGVADENGVPQVALVASPGQNWFSSGWDLRLEAAPGLVAGDPGAIPLRGGLAQPFLFPGESYRATMAWDPASGELSFSLWNVTRESEIAAGFLYLEPEAAQRLTYGLAGIAGSGGSAGAVGGGGITGAAGRSASITRGLGETEERSRTRADQDVPFESDPSDSGESVSIGFPLPFAGVPVELNHFGAEPGYARRGELLPLAGVRAGVVRAGAARPGDEEGSRGAPIAFGEQFVSSVSWSEDGLGVRIVRPYGTLPGVFKVYVSSEGGAAQGALQDTPGGASQGLGHASGGLQQAISAKEPLFILSAADLDVRASVPPRALPPGVYAIRIVYEEPAVASPRAAEIRGAGAVAEGGGAAAAGAAAGSAPGSAAGGSADGNAAGSVSGGAAAGPEPHYETEVRRMTVEVKAPKVEARLLFDLGAHPGEGVSARGRDSGNGARSLYTALDTARQSWEAEIGARVEIEADQQLDWLSVTVRSAEGTTLFQRRLENVPQGATRLSFTYPVSSLPDLFKPVELLLEWPPAQAAHKAFRPLALTIAASGEMEEVTSYQQKVRRLVRPAALDLSAGVSAGVSAAGAGGAGAPGGGGAEAAGELPAEPGGASDAAGKLAMGKPREGQIFWPQTYDLVELTVLSNLEEGFARDVRVRAVFTSPSGEEFEAAGRRLPRPGASAAWAARVLPAEPGEWRYRLWLAHPAAFPEGVELAAGAFEVLDSGRRIPSARRPWGKTERKPDGRRVASIRYRPGSTVKLEQLIGDWDSHLQIPTLNQTLSDYGVIGTDLGQPFEHDGSVVFLFGDTMGTRGFVESSLAKSPTVDPEKGLALEFYTDPSGYVLRIRPPGLRMGGFEVPSGGISLDGKIYFIVKDQMTELPQGMTFRSVLIRFDEERREFVPVREFSPLHGKFAEVVARRAPEGVQGLPFEGPAILFWGSGEYYRKGSLYLAVTRPDEIEQAGRMYYFAGLDQAGRPLWTADEHQAAPVLKHSQIGEFSVVYSEELDVWLLTYNSGTPRGIVFHWAHEPWGPWSPGQVIFEPWRDDGYTRFMHALSRPNPQLAGPVINPSPPAVEQWGGEYAPYMVERFLRYREGRLVVYYLMSTWNPYVVVLMRSEFDVAFEQAGWSRPRLE